MIPWMRQVRFYLWNFVTSVFNIRSIYGYTVHELNKLRKYLLLIKAGKGIHFTSLFLNTKKFEIRGYILQSTIREAAGDAGSKKVVTSSRGNLKSEEQRQRINTHCFKRDLKCDLAEICSIFHKNTKLNCAKKSDSQSTLTHTHTHSHTLNTHTPHTHTHTILSHTHYSSF